MKGWLSLTLLVATLVAGCRADNANALVRDVSEAEAVAGGVDKAIAHRIYTELAYLGTMAGKIVVVRGGERLQSRRERGRQALRGHA